MLNECGSSALRPQRFNLTILSARAPSSERHGNFGSPVYGADDDLRGRFERIIIDTPPVSGFRRSILQNHVDGVLFVIWTGHGEGGCQAAIEVLRSTARISGFVLPSRPQRDANTTEHYYSHDYYYQRAIRAT